MNKLRKTQLIAACLILGGCAGSVSPAQTADPSLHNYSNLSLDAGFDTVFSYQEATMTKEIFDAHFEQAVSMFTYYNNLFDIYNEYEGTNNLCTINQNAGIQPVKVDPDLIEMLETAKEYYDLSGGKFDITIGSLLKVWHEYREEGMEENIAGELAEVPDFSLLESAARHRGWEYVEIDSQNSTVYITDPDVSLDVGGIAKGFATEKIAQKLNGLDVSNGAINAGGNNRTLGQKYNGQAWRVGIQNPEGEGSLLVVQQDGACSFVTSGDYERYFVGLDGVSYHHIIDPDTLYPATYFRSVSIITPDSAAADALSTTLFTMSWEEGMKLIEAWKQEYGVPLEVIWIMDEDQTVDSQYQKKTGGFNVVWTSGLDEKIVWVH